MTYSIKGEDIKAQAQIQILKNNVQAIFFMRDATYEGTEYMNAFHEAVDTLVEIKRSTKYQKKPVFFSSFL